MDKVQIFWRKSSSVVFGPLRIDPLQFSGILLTWFVVTAKEERRKKKIRN